MRKLAILAMLGAIFTPALALDDLPLYLDEGSCASGGVSFSDADASAGSLTLATSTWKVGNSTRSWKGIPVNCTDARTGKASLEVEVKSDIGSGGYYYFYIKWSDDTKKSLAGYKHVKFWVKNLLGTTESVRLSLQNKGFQNVDLTEFPIPADPEWTEVTADLADFTDGAAAFAPADSFYGFGFKWTYPDKAAGSALHLLIDDIRFTDGDHEFAIPAQAAGEYPSAWPEHFLVSRMDVRENKKTSAAFQVGEYRYQYIMPETFVSWGDPNYAKSYAVRSNEIGVKSAFVWYNFGKVSESEVAKNLASPSFMADYVARYENFLGQLAEAGGEDYIVVLEPDMYGKLMQDKHLVNMDCADLPVDLSAASKAASKTFPANLCGWAQYVIYRARERLPKGVILGHMLNHWGVNIPYQIGQGRIEAHILGAQAQAKFLNSLGDWKGDVVFVEKTDRDAGVKLTQTPDQDWSWDSTNYAKYFTWTRILSANSGLRVVGWQVSEGSSNHPVVAHRDEAGEYFLAHPEQWVDGGFIGILFGPGMDGNANYGDDNDGGWFLQRMTEYNDDPYVLPAATSVAPRDRKSTRSRLAMSRVRGGIAFSGFDGTAVARFVDAQGRERMTISVTPGRTLARGDLPAGFSFVRLDTRSGHRTFALLPD